MKLFVSLLLLIVSAQAQSVSACGTPISPCAPDTPLTNAPVWSDTNAVIRNFFVPPVFNATALEPNSGAPLLWATDPTHPADNTNSGTSWVTPSFSRIRAFSPISAADAVSGTYYLVVNDNPDPAFINPALLTVTFNPFQVTARTSLGTLHFTPNGTFDRTNPHIWYGPDSTNPWLIKKADVTNIGGGVTSIVDLSLAANCPNVQGSLTITTNGEVTANFTGTRFAYWGNGAQDTATNTWVYDTTKGCLWLNWATGDINAAAGWGMNTTTCSACIPSAYRCTSASNLCTTAHGVHRSYIDEDGITIYTENQTFTTGPVVFIIPPGGAWPASAAMFTECDNAPSLPDCHNHKDFYPGGYMVNGAGDLANGSNQLIADRIRLTTNPNQTVSGCGPPLSGWCNLLNTINNSALPGNGNATHDSAGAADYALTMPFLEGAYMNGAGSSHVSAPWLQELDLISPNFQNQHRWRELQHHMKSQVGSCTAGLCSNGTFGQGVICGGGTCSVTTVGPHGFVATNNTISAYNCSPSSLNATGITIATVGTTTTFTVTTGWQTATTVSGECMFANTNPAANDFYAQTLVQLSPDGKIGCTPDNSERTTAADANRNGVCASSQCSQLHILCFKTR